MTKDKEDVEGGDADAEMSRKLMDLPQLPKSLTLEEKKYLLAVERGDMANVRRMLQRAVHRQDMEVNCVDSLGRGALTLAIDGENMEMVELLVIMGVETRDALLQAINAEFVEAVELLLEHEELIHKEGEPYSWQKVDPNTAMFTPDITPLILAAHRNNYEIIKILLDRGATLPMPHDIKCGCDDCIRESSEDSLRHSLSRVNEYRALASPSLIALSSTDPILTAFQLSWEMRNLAFAEQECKSEYLDLRRQCQQFAVDLLHQSRSSQELAIILNHDPDDPPYEDGEHMKLARLELAIDLKQKKFVAHPNIQQLLAAIWYEGVPGFRRKMATEKLLIIMRVALLFPFYCSLYMVAPNCATGKLMRKPFMKFLIHASSYLFFLLILILVSQRAEVQAIQLFGTEAMRKALEKELMKQRGNGPTFLELVVLIYVMGFIWEETQEIFIEGMRSYLRNMWNFIDFTRNLLYVAVAVLRCAAYIQQASEIGRDAATRFIPREQWDAFDPQLIAEGLFAAANIFSALKLVHLFSINPHLGPLQISLGRMVIDIVKFFFIYSLVLFAFACGLNQLLWYFAELEKRKCYVLPGGLPDWDNAADSCMKWRSFGNVFESSQSLFWASFGMVGLENFELAGIKSYTRFWGLLMFGSYSVINVIVLLNLLIAMMSNSYAMIDEHSDTEWKFARTRLWMSYFEESATLPPPFNIMPTPKLLLKMLGLRKKDKLRRMQSKLSRKEKERDVRYTAVMRALVWRYVSAMHRRCDEEAVTEDDINEVKGDISALRYELIEVFAKNGMDVSCADRKEKTVLGKRMKIWERRLMKDFHVAPVAALEEEVEPMEPTDEGPADRFRRIARLAVANTSSGRWDQLMQGVCVSTQIGRCRNRESFKNQQSLQKAMNEARRLVLRSPLPEGSRSGSPLEMPASPGRSLMDLIREISSETEEAAAAASRERQNWKPPGNTLSVLSAKSRPVSPSASMKGLKSPSLQPQSPIVAVAISPAVLPKCPSPAPAPPSAAGSAPTVPPSGSRPGSRSSEHSTSPPPAEDSAKQDPSLVKTNRVAGASPPRGVKRRAGEAADIAVARPAAPELRAPDGALPPPPGAAKARKEPAPTSQATPIASPPPSVPQVPTVEVTPVTPTGPVRPMSPPPPPLTTRPPTASTPTPLQEPTTKPVAAPLSEPVNPPETAKATEPVKVLEPTKTPAPAPSCTSTTSTPDSPPAHAVVTPARIGSTSSTERLIPTSPEPLRGNKKLDEVRTIKRQPKTGWL